MTVVGEGELLTPCPSLPPIAADGFSSVTIGRDGTCIATPPRASQAFRRGSRLAASTPCRSC